jgi:hypothetical protein
VVGSGVTGPPLEREEYRGGQQGGVEQVLRLASLQGPSDGQRVVR